MRLYYGWLSARYNTDPCDVYDGICTVPTDGMTDGERRAHAKAEQELAELRLSLSSTFISAQPPPVDMPGSRR